MISEISEEEVEGFDDGEVTHTRWSSRSGKRIKMTEEINQTYNLIFPFHLGVTGKVLEQAW